jgi:hypothetical protein
MTKRRKLRREALKAKGPSLIKPKKSSRIVTNNEIKNAMREAKDAGTHSKRKEAEKGTAKAGRKERQTPEKKQEVNNSSEL